MSDTVPSAHPRAPREFRLLAIVAAAVWLGIVVKAASAPMTWDEAWTFLHYTRHWSDLPTLDYANNHPLNSLLIRLGVLLLGTDSELVVRLPNVLAAAVFLGATLGALPHVRRPVIFFVFCVCEPYLLDYFAIARGYGIAAALMQLGLVVGFFRPAGRHSLPVLAACVAGAGFTIFPMAIASLCFVAILGAARFAAPGAGPPGRIPGPTFWSVLACWSATAVIALLGLKQVSRPGVPVFGSGAGWYHAVPFSVAWKNFGPVAARWLLPPFLCAAAAFAVARLRRHSARTRILLGCSLLSMALIEAASLALHAPLPTDRVLIPWYPLWVLALLSMLEDFSPDPRRIGARVLSTILAAVGVLAVASGFRHLDFHVYEDWPTEAAVPAELAQAILVRRCLPPEITLPHDYYLFRWFGTATPAGLPRC